MAAGPYTVGKERMLLSKRWFPWEKVLRSLDMLKGFPMRGKSWALPYAARSGAERGEEAGSRPLRRDWVCLQVVGDSNTRKEALQ